MIPSLSEQVVLIRVSGANPPFWVVLTMQDRLPDFFLGSSDDRGDWAIARACWITGRLRKSDGRECALVEVAPPVIGQPFGLGDKDIFQLLLMRRWKGEALYAPIDRPIPVIILRIPNPSVVAQDLVHDSDIELSAWGEIYPTLKAAERGASRWPKDKPLE